MIVTTNIYHTDKPKSKSSNIDNRQYMIIRNWPT